MGRRTTKKQSGINLQMYKHFAIVTIFVTATLAMFADGENQQAADAQAKAKAGQSTNGDGKTRLVINTKDQIDEDYDDESGGGGGGGGGWGSSEGGGSGSGSSFIPDSFSEEGASKNRGFLAEMGLTRQSFSQLPENQKKAIRMKSRSRMSQEERDRRTQDAIAASAARSGH